MLLFTGRGSSNLVEEAVEQIATSVEEIIPDSIQDLSAVTFEIFDIDTANREFSASTTIGIDINIYDLENIDFYLSEINSSDNIIWSSIAPNSFVVSENDGQKDVYLFIRDNNSELILESSIVLDLNLPRVEIISGPSYYSSSTEASFLFTANCVPTLFEYSFNDELFQTSDLLESISEGRIFEEGLNIINIRIKDELGRVASNSFEWIVDFEAPETSFIFASTTESNIVLGWAIASTSKNNAALDYFEFEKYIDSELSKSIKLDADVFFTTIAIENNLSFRIRGVDLAGNIGDWDVFAYDPRPIIPEAISNFTHDDEYLSYYSAKFIWSSGNNYSSENSFYDMRYVEYTDECTILNFWDKAFQVATSTMPVPPDEIVYQEVVIDNLNSDINYCFAIRVFNGKYWSDFSNIAYLKTKSAPPREPTVIPTPNDYISLEILTKKDSPYILMSLGKVRTSGLIIEPGVIIKFRDDYGGGYYRYPVKLMADGPIIAIGTEDDPIIFTSDKDDSAGGDTNQDLNQTNPVIGSWGSIELYSKGSIFENVIVRYAGRDVRRGFFSIYEDESIITNSRFENMSNGIEVFHASSTNPAIISNNVFSNCGGAIAPQGDSNPITENNIFE